MAMVKVDEIPPWILATTFDYDNDKNLNLNFQPNSDRHDQAAGQGSAGRRRGRRGHQAEGPASAGRHGDQAAGQEAAAGLEIIYDT